MNLKNSKEIEEKRKNHGNNSIVKRLIQASLSADETCHYED